MFKNITFHFHAIVSLCFQKSTIQLNNYYYTLKIEQNIGLKMPF